MSQEDIHAHVCVREEGLHICRIFFACVVGSLSALGLLMELDIESEVSFVIYGFSNANDSNKSINVFFGFSTNS